MEFGLIKIKAKLLKKCLNRISISDSNWLSKQIVAVNYLVLAYTGAPSLAKLIMYV